MSAVPLPKPESVPPPAPPEAAGRDDTDGWALLEGLRRRLDDQISQGRKTQQQVSQLAESIAGLVDVQRRRTRNLNLNSFVAYLIFTMLCGAGFYLLYRSRTGDLAETRKHVQVERDAAVKRADELAAKAAARERADASAWEVFQLLEAGKRADATAKLAAAEGLALSRTERAVLAARAHETKVQEVEAALKAAATAFKAGRHGDVIAPLEAALVGEPAGPRAATMHYYVGVAYSKKAVLDKAVLHLDLAVGAEKDHEDVRFHLASALDRSADYVKARTEYSRFATAHPQSPFAAFAMRRAATLSRIPATTVPKPAVAKPANPGTSAASVPMLEAGSAAPKPKPKWVPKPKPPAPKPPPVDDEDPAASDGSATPPP
jgi:tetratricopeptide (TPR) repeat protein